VAEVGELRSIMRQYEGEHVACDVCVMCDTWRGV
jgi:hypothetical protein